MFDEFNNESENKETIVGLRLVHNKVVCTDKKVACMDKILDDMRKKFEIEQKKTIPDVNE
jgi:hypothetical protein